MALIGKKVRLRLFRLQDADKLWDSVHNPYFNRLTGTHATFTRNMIDRYIENQVNADDDSRASFIIEPLENTRAVGEVVINDIDHDNHSGNIRISLFSEDDLNKGYGTEAMQLMVDYGFRELGLHRIALGVYDFNPRAIHVYEKMGFKREGVMRDSLYWDGEYIDEIMMSVLSHEWKLED